MTCHRVSLAYSSAKCITLVRRIRIACACKTAPSMTQPLAGICGQKAGQWRIPQSLISTKQATRLLSLREGPLVCDWGLPAGRWTRNVTIWGAGESCLRKPAVSKRCPSCKRISCCPPVEHNLLCGSWNSNWRIAVAGLTVPVRGHLLVRGVSGAFARSGNSSRGLHPIFTGLD